MPDESIAVMADIHGNTWALDAVLADIERQGIERIVDLGDSGEHGRPDWARWLATGRA